jgi:hypothetical protein
MLSQLLHVEFVHIKGYLVYEKKTISPMCDLSYLQCTYSSRYIILHRSVVLHKLNFKRFERMVFRLDGGMPMNR